MSYIYTIPSFLYDKRIYECLYTLAYDHESYSDLDDEDKELLVVKIIDVLGTDAYQIIIGSDNFDKTLQYFSKFLQTGNSMDSYDLVVQMRENAVEHYAYDLEQLFNEIKSKQNDWRHIA